VTTTHAALCLLLQVLQTTSLSPDFAPIADDLTYPSRLIQPQGELWWLLETAGQDLKLGIIKTPIIAALCAMSTMISME